MTAPPPGQADEIPEAFSRHVRSQFPPGYVLPKNEVSGRWRHLTGPAEREFWREVEALAARPAPGVWTVSECVERIGVLAGALHEIKSGYPAGTLAHDAAHAAIDLPGSPYEPPQPADFAISAWIENNPREFATWLATQRHVGGVTPESVAIAAQDARPELAAARGASDLEVASVIAERNQLRMALQWLADDGNLEARDRLAAIRPELTRAASRPAPEFLAPRAVEIQPEYEDDEPHAKPAPGLAAAVASLIKLTESHERVMYAATIDIIRGDPESALRMLDEQLDGWDGRPWNTAETGGEWLERTREGA